MRTAIVLLTFGCVAGMADAQSWTNRYDGIAHGKDYITSLAVDKSGNIFVAGTSEGADSFVPDFVLIKYSTSGSPSWVRRYTKYNNEVTSGRIGVDAEGNVVVVGASTWDIMAPRGMLRVMKVSANGEKLWTNSIPGYEYQGLPQGVAWGRNGELAAISQTNLVMYSGAGTALATNAYDYWGMINDQILPAAMAFDRNGNLAVSVFDEVGWTTVKYSSDGQRQWLRKYSSAGEYAFPSSVAFDREGNVIVSGGVTADPYSGETDVGITKYSQTGTLVWTNRNSFPGGAMGIDKDGNVLIAGLKGAAKYSPSGRLLWTNQQPGLTNRYVYELTGRMDSSQNLIVSAVTQDGNVPPQLVLLKYSSSGLLLWMQRQVLAGNPFSEPGAAEVAVDDNENVFLAVTSESGSNSYDLLTIKYVPPCTLGIAPASNGVVLSWGNTAFGLQAAPGASGTFTNIPQATSPHTNIISDAQRYFRLTPLP